MASFQKIMTIFCGVVLLIASEAKAACSPGCLWSGFYAGFNTGLIISSDRIRLSPQGSWITNESSEYQDFIRNNGKTRLSDTDVMAGGQIGYNYQINNCYVIGIEADADYLRVANSRQNQHIHIDDQLAYAFKDRVSHHWLATIRPRFGYAMGLFFPYITAGYAAGDVHIRSVISGLDYMGVTNEYYTIAHAKKTLHGWTAGFGLEYTFNPCYSIKAEYLYVSLGDFRFISAAQNESSSGYFERRSVSVFENCLRLGLNYRL